MIDKLGVLPKTLDSPIVMDGLKGVEALESVASSRGLVLVVGGTAVQSYLPDEFRRPTSDIDLSVVRPLNYAEFKAFTEPAVAYLRDNGYNMETRKCNTNYKLIVTREGDEDGVIIEFSRRNERKFAEQKSRLERELENGRRKVINGGGTGYLAASPEDIAVPKFVRGVGTLQRHPDIEAELRQIYGTGSLDLRAINRHLLVQRAVAEKEEDLGSYEKVRLKADMYDILCLSRFAGFNEHYLFLAGSEWERTSTPSEQRSLINALLNLSL